MTDDATVRAVCGRTVLSESADDFVSSGLSRGTSWDGRCVVVVATSAGWMLAEDGEACTSVLWGDFSGVLDAVSCEFRGGGEGVRFRKEVLRGDGELSKSGSFHSKCGVCRPEKIWEFLVGFRPRGSGYLV